jgi:hypothetical protein
VVSRVRFPPSPLADYNSSIVCKDNDGAGATVAEGSGTGPLAVPVNQNDQVACAITNFRKSGQLRVASSLSPASDPGRFDLQIDGVTASADVGDGGDTGLQTLYPGNHTVGESAGTATSLANYTSSILCRGNDGAGATVASASDTGPLDVPIADGDEIACTITNTRIIVPPVIAPVNPPAITPPGSVQPAKKCVKKKKGKKKKKHCKRKKKKQKK